MIFINPNAHSNQNIPNLGLAYAATHFKTRVIDLNTVPEPANRYLEHKDDVLAISVQSRTYSAAGEIAMNYKNKYPEAQIKSISGFLDVQCCYPYINFNDKIEYTEPFSDNYPFPDYELFDSFSVFLKNWQKGAWSYAVMTSQGCPFQCTYCASRNRKWHSRSPENCVEELRRAKKRWGIKYFVVIDDCFNVDKKRVLEFCDLVKDSGLGWSCSNGLRADRFDEDIARAMHASGCREFSFGMETADPEILLRIRKGETLEQIENAVAIARKYFDPSAINGFFIIGLPGSSFEKDLASLRWAEDKGIHAHFSYYIPSDLQLRFDGLFYGPHSRPHSDAYDKEQQARVYRMAQNRWTSKSGIIQRITRWLNV